RAIRNLILTTGDALPGLADTLTGKRVNAYAALTCTDARLLARTAPVSSSVRRRVGESISIAAHHLRCAEGDGPLAVTVEPSDDQPLVWTAKGLVSVPAPFLGYENKPLPVAGVDTMIAPYWDDLTAMPGCEHNVFVEVLGEAPSREFVIEWRNLPRFGCGLSDT